MLFPPKKTEFLSSPFFTGTGNVFGFLLGTKAVEFFFSLIFFFFFFSTYKIINGIEFATYFVKEIKMFNITRNGLDAIGKELGVISNNIANSNTNAFKRSRSEFVDFILGALSSSPQSKVD